MPDDTVIQFKERISPYSDAFDQLCLTCAAVRIEDKWVSAYTCLALNNSTDAGAFQPRIVKAGSEFVALFLAYSTDAFDRVLKEVEKGCLSLAVHNERYEIFLHRAAAGMKSQSVSSQNALFGNIWRPDREWAENKMAYRPSIQIQASGDRFYELFSQDANERISRQLRAHIPPYNGLDGLLQFMGSRNRPNSSGNEALIEIKAVLPFSTSVQEEQVYVECPESLVSKLSVLFFFSSHESMTVTYSEDLAITSRSKWATMPFRIPWPLTASQAEAHIRYNGEELERITLRHWATGANWRVMVDSYFDPDSKLLKQALRGEGQGLKEEKRSEAFEQAIARLLNLGGIAATWHGALRHSGKPDVAGYCEIPGRRVALIGECTLEKPSAKLSTLKSRVSKLRESTAEVADVLAVVFTACDPAESDYAGAAQSGIALLGCNEIARIQELVEANAGANAIIKQIENAMMLHDLPRITRWEPRY